jgi:RNA polymerase sigma factor (TIGR02999 family)
MPRTLDGNIVHLKALLDAARSGDKAALGELFSLTYSELHRLAHARLTRGQRPMQLDTTSLVHESYLRCLKVGQLNVVDRSHFLAYAAKVMRSIVVDVARQRQAERHGGDATHVMLTTDLAESVHASEDEIIRVDEALQDLARIDERLVRVVEMRFFAGMREQEIAAVLGVTERTVRRDWEKARLLLHAALK